MQQNQTKLFILSALTFGLGGLSGSALGIVWIYMQTEFELPLSALGILVTISTIGRLFTSFTSGVLIGRYGMIWVLLAGMVAMGLGMAGFALAPTWFFIMAAGFVHGVGAGVMGTALSSFAAVHFSSRHMNWLHGSFGIGATFGPLFVTYLVIDLGIAWQWNYVLFTVLRVILILLVFITRHDWQMIPNGEKSKESSVAKMNDTLRLPIVWLLILIFVVATSIETTAGQFANSLLVDSRSIDPKTAGIWVSIYWGSLTVSRFLIGFIIKYVRHGVLLRLNMIGTMLGAGLLWSNISPIVSLIGLAMIGFTVAPFAPVMSSDTPGRVGIFHTANTIGFQFTGAGVGIAFLPWLAGVLAEYFGLETIPPFLLVIATITFLLHEIILRREAQIKMKPV